MSSHVPPGPAPARPLPLSPPGGTFVTNDEHARTRHPPEPTVYFGVTLGGAHSAGLDDVAPVTVSYRAVSLP